MLSIIISSVNADHLNLITKNIELTIGIPYELIVIDNSDAAMGLCEVYNLGASKANYEMLCYMHEDIDIKTHEWGRKIFDCFEKDERLGLLGVVGSTYKSSVFSGWAPYGETPRTIDHANIIQCFKYQDRPSTHYFSNPNNVDLQEVAVLDGVWLCTKKKIIEALPFDASTFKEFHCYDLDISLSISREYKVAVTFDILIEHYSEGKFERDWAESTFALHKKWRKYLPLNKEKLNQKEITYIEKKFYRNAVAELKKLEYSKWEILKVLNSSNIRKLNLFVYIKLYIATIIK